MHLNKSSSTLELIKYLSIITMIIDHTGLIFYDDNFIMRFIGRFALIGFSFILAYNYRFHTSNKSAYKMRLFTWAIISQVPYMMTIDSGLNIMFLLLMGLYAIDAVNMIKNDNKTILPTIYLSGALVLSLFSGYFFFGVVIIVLMYYAHDSNSKTLFMMLLLSVFFLNFNIMYGLAALISLSSIYYINTKLEIRKINKYIFYAFYPVHLLILWIISTS